MLSIAVYFPLEKYSLACQDIGFLLPLYVFVSALDTRSSPMKMWALWTAANSFHMSSVAQLRSIALSV